MCKQGCEAPQLTDPDSTDSTTVTAMSDEKAFRAAIFARPGDDGPRAVYADWLQEQGAQHGHFIGAQLRGDAKAALTHLAAALKANGLPLFQDTDTLPKHPGLGHTGKSALRCFDRGFLRACHVAVHAQQHADADAWPLVEWLTVTAPGEAEFISAIAPRLSSLHSFASRDGSGARVLAITRPQKLRRLSILELRDAFDLEPLIDEKTELELAAFSAVHLQRTPAGVRLRLEGPRGGAPLERLLRSVVLPQSKVVLTWNQTDANVHHPLHREVRALLDSKDAEVTEWPLVVMG